MNTALRSPGVGLEPAEFAPPPPPQARAALADSPPDTLLAWVDEAMARQAILENRYFASLRDGTMSRDAFRDSQQQFAFAVSFFSRSMAALLARMPESAQRQPLIHNLAEEHGFDEGDHSGRPAGFDPARSHDLTIRSFLRTLGVSREEIAHARQGRAVRAFNLGLFGACAMERTELAFAALGVIEYAFAGISARIGQEVVRRGWLAEGGLIHYNLHAEIDQRHAADFFQAIEPAWQSGGQARLAIEDGIEFGLHIFNQLYEELTGDGAGLP
jgi:pyrroloquinoline-quinone synthase